MIRGRSASIFSRISAQSSDRASMPRGKSSATGSMGNAGVVHRITTKARNNPRRNLDNGWNPLLTYLLDRIVILGSTCQPVIGFVYQREGSKCACSREAHAPECISFIATTSFIATARPSRISRSPSSSTLKSASTYRPAMEFPPLNSQTRLLPT